MIYLKSVVEVGGIFVEAAQEVYYDARKWLGRTIVDGLDRADTKLADRYNDPNDEI